MPRATFTGTLRDGYRAAIKDDAGKVVWTCGHNHLNRDHSTMGSGQSARACARFCLDVASDPTMPKRLRLFYDHANPANAALNARGFAELAYAESVAEEIRQTLGLEG